MNDDKLIKWFDEKLYNCYHIEKGNNIYWIYCGKNYNRAKKLANIDGRKIDIPKHKKILFQQDLVNKVFYCDHNNIWKFLNKHTDDYYEIISIINRTRNIQKLKNYTFQFWDLKKEFENENLDNK